MARGMVTQYGMSHILGQYSSVKITTKYLLVEIGDIAAIMVRLWQAPLMMK